MAIKGVCAAICAAGLICAGGQVALAQEVPNASEVANLKMMFEEECMAHDLYIALGEKWESRKFDNISRAETQHNNLVAAQLDRLGVAKPDASVPGKYADPEIQKLYDVWLEQGMKSQADAFRVGTELERRDIADLENPSRLPTIRKLRRSMVDCWQAPRSTWQPLLGLHTVPKVPIIGQSW